MWLPECPLVSSSIKLSSIKRYCFPVGPQCECVGRTVVASNSRCGIVPLSLAQEFVAEVSPFVKELVANSRSLSYSSLIWRGPGDRMGLCVTVTRHS